jgi:hypothetical protein
MGKAKKKVEKKVVEEKQTIWTIGVDARADTEETSTPDPNDRWDRASTSTTWDIRGLKLIDKEGSHYFNYRETVDVNFEPEKGKIYHLLYAVYSTGDSFGHDDSACFEAIGVYQDRKIAEENEKRLREGKPTVTEKWGTRVVLLMEGMDKGHEYHPPWNGYFESLNRLEVESFVLN